MLKDIRGLVLGVFFVSMLFSSSFVFGQQEEKQNVVVAENATVDAVASVAMETVESKVEKQVSNELTPEWLWGEVVSVNSPLNQFVVKHMDYESYEETQTALVVDDKTMFENVVDLTHVLPGDHVTVDYKTKDGVNIVELAVVEKVLPVDQEKMASIQQAVPEVASEEIVSPEAVNANETVK